MVDEFLGHKQGGVDFSGCVLGPNPELKKVLKMRGRKRREEINKYVDDFYKENQEILEKIIREFSQKWSKVEKEYFALVRDIFNLKQLPNYQYTGYLSIINCGPRFLETKSFQVFYRRLEDSIYVTIHEILHFFFYDYAIKKYSKIFKKLDPNQGVFWDLAEVFNSVILSEPEFKKIHKQKRDWSYPAHRKYLEDLKKYWKESKDIDIWIKESSNYLKNKNLTS